MSFDPHVLLDPHPPTPGAAQRAAVTARTRSLVRRRRLAGSAGALAAVAVVAGGVALFAGASGSSDPARVAVAASPSNPATVTVTISDYPAGVTAWLTLVGFDQTYTADADSHGRFHLDGVVPGTYEATYTVSEETGPGQTGRFPVTVQPGANQFEHAL